MNIEVWKGELEVNTSKDKEEVILHAWFSAEEILVIRVPNGFKLSKAEDVGSEDEYYKIERSEHEQARPEE